MINFNTICEVAQSVVDQYHSAHSSLSLIDLHSIANKIKYWRDRALYLQRCPEMGGSKLATFQSKVDKLFEVLRCQCRMWRDEAGQAQIDCHCHRQDKIPPMELEFIYAQRHRGSGLPALKIGSVDRRVTNELAIQAERKVIFNVAIKYNNLVINILLIYIFLGNFTYIISLQSPAT